MLVLERHKLLLGLLHSLGGDMGNLDFQKLLFLYCLEFEQAASFEFVPYNYGAFSFTSYGDKRRLTKMGLLADSANRWQITNEGEGIGRAKRLMTGRTLSAFLDRYSSVRGPALVVEAYRRFPYYAINSQILEELPLEQEELRRIQHARPVRTGPALLTLGYEGRCLEGYLNCLLSEGTTILCDVRRNPLSRKYGFSKGTLQKACEGVGLRYEHQPELGIPSEKRRGLSSQSDYDTLFTEYRTINLPNQTATLAGIRDWVESGERVVLTCFEHQAKQCHRHCVSDALEAAYGPALRARHL